MWDQMKDTSTQEISSAVFSPCIGICEYAKEIKERICRGCGRTAEEISEWFKASNERKREIKKLSEIRKKALTPTSK